MAKKGQITLTQAAVIGVVIASVAGVAFIAPDIFGGGQKGQQDASNGSLLPTFAVYCTVDSDCKKNKFCDFSGCDATSGKCVPIPKNCPQSSSIDLDDCKGDLNNDSIIDERDQIIYAKIAQNNYQLNKKIDKECADFNSDGLVNQDDLLCINLLLTDSDQYNFMSCPPLKSNPNKQVCGCDGLTYSSDCKRQMARIALDREGACEEETCSVQGGTICSSDETCSGSWLTASDSDLCCEGDCVIGLCEDKCGDGICAEVVCQGPECPCAETLENCPQDCEEEIPGLNIDFIEVRDGIEIYHYTVPKGGTLMNGYIVKPKGDGPFPAVILNHGGYGSAELFAIGDTADQDTQDFVGTGNGIYLAQNGYVAIACDYTHKDLDKYGLKGQKDGWGAGASEENIARALKNIEVLKSLDYVDGDKITMLGNSMGGFLTVGVAQKTDELRGTIVIAGGIKDGNPQSSADIVVEFSSPPEDLVKDISCPMLLLNGEDDTIVNVKYPKHLKELLDQNNKQSKSIIYPNVGHELLRKHRELAYGEVFRFLDGVLGNS